MIFIFLTASFYADLAGKVTGVDVNSESFRARISPLNTSPDPSLASVVRDASTGSFHLAMFVGAALLVLGALINAVGIRNDAARRQEEPETKAAAPHAEAATE
jgi:hypothetical protein